MIDFAHITVSAGAGGRGSGSRAQIMGKRYGRADGGDGGSGGNVYLEATRDQNTLEPYRYLRHYEAKNGVNGFSNLRRGANGEDLVLKVPVGTLVNVMEERPRMINKKQKIQQPQPMVYDLTDDGQKVLLARGGQGGRGNAHLRDEFGRRPRTGEAGEAGERLDLTMELKMIADVGLIGLPNAGKSTLLAALTAAKPAIAAYPFTTLEPNLGVFKTSGKGEEKRVVIADIPGLIEGASRGRGLGDLFLRHIERTKLLVHLIDVSTAVNAWQAYETIRNELKVYSKELVKKKEIVVLNKIDMVDSQRIDEAALQFKDKRKKVFLISAQQGLGLDDLTREIFKRLR